jgi:hypothetical protein
MRSSARFSEVRDLLRHPVTRTSETKGTNKSTFLVPLFDLKFLLELAATLQELRIGGTSRAEKDRPARALYSGML